MQFLNLVLFGYVSELLQEALQVASRHRSKTTHKMRGPCSDLRLYFLSQMIFYWNSWCCLSSLPPPLVSHLLKPFWSEEVQKVEELLQVILQWGPCQQQLMIYLIAIEDPEKLESEAGTGRRKGYQWQVTISPHRHFPIASS